MVDAALGGDLDKVEFIHDEIFHLDVPVSVPGVPEELLHPRKLWKDEAEYEATAKELARKFKENFNRFEGAAERIVAAGPY
jgi:phosphoenolpyruvate carboxykinase (ATP)